MLVVYKIRNADLVQAWYVEQPTTSDMTKKIVVLYGHTSLTLLLCVTEQKGETPCIRDEEAIIPTSLNTIS